MELAKRIEGDANLPEGVAKTVLQKAAAQYRQALRAGREVDLLGVVRVKLRPEGLAGKVGGSGALLVTPGAGLIPSKAPAKAALTQAPKQPATVVMAVKKADPFVKVTAKQLSQRGRKVLLVESADAMMRAVSDRAVDVILMDADMEMAEETRLWLKTHPDRSLISLVALYPMGQDPEDVDEFRICEDEVLQEPYEIDELDRVIGEEVQRIEQERRYFRHEISYQFPAQGLYQQQAADMMEKLVATSGLPEESQMGIVVAFREAVDNAIRHGSKNNRKAPVTVAYVLDREKVTVTIEDEGPGFDSAIYLETRVSGNAVKIARARHREGRRGGLGIMLMLKSVDKLEYNRTGNQAKLTKYLPTAKAGVA